MAHSTKTQAATSTKTVVGVMVAVATATIVGSIIGASQWASNAAISIDSLDAITTSMADDKILLRSDDGSKGNMELPVVNVGDLNDDGHDDLAVYQASEDDSHLYLYYGGDATFDTEPDWELRASTESVGYSVAPAGDVNGDGIDDMIFGDVSKSTREGSAYIVYGVTGGPSEEAADWEVDGLEGEEGLGLAVSGLGDVNGDGYDDVAVYVGQSSEEKFDSKVQLYYGGAGSIDTTVDWAYLSAEQTDFHNILAGADVNGDGYSDLILGNPDNERIGANSIEAFYGSAIGFTKRPNFLASVPTGQDFGGLVAPAGDINADGYDDIIVGAIHYNQGQTGEGAIYVYYGSATGLSRLERSKVESNVVDAWLGISAAALGDISGDGYDDIIATAPGYDRDGDGRATGQAMLYGGSATGIMRAPIGIAGASLDMELYGTWATTGTTLVGSSGVDIVVAVDNIDEADYDGPVVIIYPNVDL